MWLVFIRRTSHAQSSEKMQKKLLRGILIVVIPVLLLAGFGVWKTFDHFERQRDIGSQFLVDAANANVLWIVQFLLDQGIDPNVNIKSDTQPFTKTWNSNPLIAAAGEGNAEVVRLLLSRGASVDLRERGRYAGEIGDAIRPAGEPHNWPPSGDCTAPFTAQWEAASRDKIGVTALMTAAHRGHREVVETLLTHHASLDA